MGQSIKKSRHIRERRASVLEKRFQENLRRLRKARKMTQGELSEAIGRDSASYISQLETGIRGFRTDLVEELATFFNVDPGEFFVPSVRRAALRSIFEELPEECFNDLRGTGKCQELVKKFKAIVGKEIKPRARLN